MTDLGHIERLVEQWARWVLGGSVAGPNGYPRATMFARLSGEGAELERRLRLGLVSKRDAQHLCWASAIRRTGSSDAPVPEGVIEADRAIAAMPRRLQRALVAEHFHDWPVERRARYVGCSPRRYRTRLERAYEWVAAHLEQGVCA